MKTETVVILAAAAVGVALIVSTRPPAYPVVTQQPPSAVASGSGWGAFWNFAGQVATGYFGDDEK